MALQNAGLVSFTVPGRIRGKGRPRFTKPKGGNFVRTYTDERTANAEATVRSLAATAMAERAPLQGPLILDVTITLNTPQSWSKKKKAEAHHATGKPDVDNIAKLLGDSLNGIVWADDSQICELHIRRHYDDACGEGAEIIVQAASQWVQRRDAAAPTYRRHGTRGFQPRHDIEGGAT